MIETLVLFVIGFFILYKGSSFLIDGAVFVARRLGISEFLIGITIVGIGTSIPEFSVTFFEALKGKSNIGLGTILGSNIFNILFILGLSAMIFPMSIKSSLVRKDLIINIFTILFVFIFTIFPIGGESLFEISRLEGFLIFILFIIWLIYLILNNKPTKQLEMEKGPSLSIFVLPLSIIMIISGLIGVILGAKWVVEGGEFLAKLFHFSPALIGIIFIGIGTSLPELVVSVFAAKKGNVGIALGNIIGSNIFDFLGILGLTTVFNSVIIARELFYDFIVIIGISILLFGLVFKAADNFILGRLKGFIFVSLYLIYIFTRIQF